MPPLSFASLPLDQWCQRLPLISQLIATEELLWLNPKLIPFHQAKTTLPLSDKDTQDATARLQRFSTYIRQVFPETEPAQGLIESPLRAIPQMQTALSDYYKTALPGRFLLKCDSHLPISGSIKARGGIYEVLKYAETLALEAGLITESDNYVTFNDEALRQHFAQHRVIVGSTGNLGLSIGIMSARLGFKVTVHMSADARQWKKDLLRSKGVDVVEHADDYSKAVEQGRLEASASPNSHFVDDEHSQDLFLGYSVAALRLQKQLEEQNIVVDQAHPLFVYLPCGVGGGPGGVAFGLKQRWGDNVHCFFAEPTHSPCMLLGMYSELHEGISVQDIGLDNHTCADGLAVGRPSGFVGKVMEPLLSGIFTVADNELYKLLALLKQNEDIMLEPSALAGMPGIHWANQRKDYLKQHAIEADKITHIVWATGGNMVPETEQQAYLDQGISLLNYDKP